MIREGKAGQGAGWETRELIITAVKNYKVYEENTKNSVLLDDQIQGEKKYVVNK